MGQWTWQNTPLLVIGIHTQMGRLHPVITVVIMSVNQHYFK